MQQVLEQDGRFDPETIAEMVHRANGNYLKALEYADPGEDKSYYFEAFQKIMRLAYQSKVVELIDLAEELGGIGRERQKDFFVYAMQLVREYFMMNFGKPALVFMTRDEKVFGNNFARFINERNVISLNALFEEGYRHITMNGNGRIVFTDSLLKVVRLIRR
jgi:DNA polymerase-3 subunit delta'